jgi:DNA-binding NarL/FixJ family response regulator
LVADDQMLFRSGLARLLAEDPRVEVVGEAVDGIDAVEQCGLLQPDVVLMDIRMPQMDGLAATERIVSSGGATKVLILTTFETETEVVGAMKAGARGYILKDSSAETVISSVLAVALGGQVIASTVASRLFDTDGRRVRRSEECLTPRETEILSLIASGDSNKQIARRLCIADKTVRNHLSHIYEKLQVSDRSQAVLFAVKKGLVEL